MQFAKGKSMSQTSQKSRRILVTGATGNIGRRVVTELTPHVTVRALSRNAGSACLPPDVEIIEGDLTSIAALSRALVDVEAVFLLWPFLSAEAAAPVIEVIGRQAIPLVYLSTAGAGDPEDRAANPISRMHYAVEQLIELAVPVWTMVRPTSFASNVLTFWAAQIASGATVRWPFANTRLSVIHDGDIGAVVAKALLGGGFLRKKLLLTGPGVLTPREEIAIIGRVIGRDVAFAEMAPEAAREQMLGWGMPSPIVEGVLGYWAKRVAEAEPITDLVAEITGFSARTFEEWVKDNRSKFG
jgi:uncharacterized protein YbjT (DUF2867 family)